MFWNWDVEPPITSVNKCVSCIPLPEYGGGAGVGDAGGGDGDGVGGVGVGGAGVGGAGVGGEGDGVGEPPGIPETA